MMIAIISDVHNNETNLKKVLDYCQGNKIEKMICCGDLASKETLDFLNDNFSGEIHYAFGNMDNDQIRELNEENVYKHTMIHKNFGQAEFDGAKVAFVHFPDLAEDLARRGTFKYVFYGHTHKPWTQKIDKTVMLNPGNVAGEIFPPTFAVWDTRADHFDLIKIHELK